MKIKISILLAMMVSVSFFTKSYSQSMKGINEVKAVKYKDNVNAPLTINEMKMLEEAYSNHLNEDVLNNPLRVKRIKHLLRNRIIIKYIPNPIDQKPCVLLSTIPLFDVYNKNLVRDVNFDKNTFNPLKYNFNFFSKITEIYRVDNTDYFIIIKSQFQ